ncbi:MAG: ribonuclease D, partial [Ilumatobacteraceae bacterium]
MAHTFVRDQDSLEQLLSRLNAEERIALDTEFHRERTYFPRLALIQLAWSDGIAIIDPLSVDPTSITRIFDANHLIVLHAAQQ